MLAIIYLRTENRLLNWLPGSQLMFLTSRFPEIAGDKPEWKGFRRRQGIRDRKSRHCFEIVICNAD